VLTLALDTSRILITTDKDFGELVYRREQKHKGVILLRLDGYTPEQRAIILLKVLDKHIDELLHAFTVVQDHFTRIRPMT
jgi:predicted nuclease of predicted toxin-antitoxin system